MKAARKALPLKILKYSHSTDHAVVWNYTLYIFLWGIFTNKT